MRLIDEQGNDILEEDCDLTKGEIIETEYVDPAAYETIDNIVKFALDESDYEHVRMYRVYTEMDYQLMEQNEKNAQRESMLEQLPTTLSDIDDAICLLYEMTIGE